MFNRSQGTEKGTHCKKSPSNRNSRECGKVAVRIRGLTRTHGRAWRWRNTKTLWKATRRKGGSNKEPREKDAGKTPLTQETEKPQEGALEEQQEAPVSSSTVPKEGEEGDQQQIDHKDSLEEKKGRVTYNTRAPRTGVGEGGRSRKWRKTKARKCPPGNKRKHRASPWNGRKTPS